MSNIGFATVSVIPSFSGAQAALSSGMAGPSAAAGTQAGGLFGGAFTGILAGGALVAGLAGGLAAVGGTFDEAFDAIRIKTGATGQELAGLKDVFRNVVSDVPTDFGSAAEAIGGLQQRLHLSDGDLENVSERVLELSRITETDLAGNIDSVTRLFGDWGITTDDQGERLDQLFRASQLSGVGVSELASQVTAFGSPLRQLGFGLTDSLALLGRFESEGVNTSTVMSGMRQAVKNFASGLAENEAGVTNFQDVIAGVKDGTFDLSDAMTVFGARAGSDMFAAIKEGRFDLADFRNEISAGSDTILGAAEDTNDWRESLELLKNRALVALEPIATRVFNALGQGADFIVSLTDAFGQGGLSGVTDLLAEKFGALSGPAKIFAGVVAALAGGAGIAGLVGILGLVGGALATILSPVVLVVGGLAALAAGAVYAYTHFEGFRNVVDSVASWLTGTAWPAIQDFARGVQEAFGEAVAWVQERWPAISEAVGHVLTVLRTIIGGATAWIKANWHAWGDDLLNFVRDVWGFIVDSVRNAIHAVQSVIDIVLGIINGDWGRAWDGIKGLLSAVWDQMRNIVNIAWQALKAVIGAGLSGLKALWRGAWSAIKAALSAAWNAIRSAVSAGISAVVNFFQALPGRVISAITRLPGMLLNAGRAALRALWDGFKSVWESARGWLANIPHAAATTLGSLVRSLGDIGRRAIDALWQAMQDAWDNVLDWLGDLPGQVSDAIGGIVDTINPFESSRIEGPTITMPVEPVLTGGIGNGNAEFSFARNNPTRQRVVSTAPQPQTVRLVFEGTDAEFMKMIRKTVRTEHGGNVEVAFGSR